VVPGFRLGLYISGAPNDWIKNIDEPKVTAFREPQKLQNFML
jgi:hypothetical protein